MWDVGCKTFQITVQTSFTIMPTVVRSTRNENPVV